MTAIVSTLFKAQDQTGPAADAVVKNLRAVETASQSAGQEAKSFASRVSDIAGGILAASALSSIAGEAKNVAGAMISGNAQFEDYNTRLTVMLHSAGDAKDRLAELAKFGAETPFELPQVVEADTVLQGFGLHSEEAAKKFGKSGEEILRIAGDVASGTGAGFKEMTLLIGKFSSGATGEAISRMQELGITSREELTKMGLEFSKAGELTSPLPEAMSTVLTLMQQKYGGLMDVQSHTFNGMLSNVQDWAGGTIRTMGQPLFAAAERQMEHLLAVLNSNDAKRAIANLTEHLRDGVEGAMAWLPRLASGVTTAAGAISRNFVPAMTALSIATLAYAAVSLPAATAALTAFIAEQTAAESLLMTTLGPLALVAAAAYGLAKAYQYFDDVSREHVAAADANNAAMTAATDALEAYNQQTIVHSTFTREAKDRVEELTKAHTDLAVQLDKLGQMSEGARHQLGVSDDQMHQMKGTLEGLDGQIKDASTSLATLAAADHLQQAFGDDRRESIDSYRESLKGLGDAVSGFAPLSAEAQKAIDGFEKAADKASTSITADFNKIIDVEQTYQSGREQSASEHTKRLEALEVELAKARGKEAKAGVQAKIDAENAGYADSERSAAIAYAKEEAAQRQHLGQMLIDYVSAQASIRNADNDTTNDVSQQKLDDLVTKFRTAYGVIESTTDQVMGQAKAHVEDFFNGSENSDQLVSQLTDAEHKAIDLRTESEKLNAKYTTEILHNFDPAKQSAYELYKQLSDVPARVTTEIAGRESITAATQAYRDLYDRTQAIPATTQANTATNTADTTALLDATIGSLDLLDRHPVVDKQITTNAPTITGFIVDTGNAYSSVGALPAVDKSITTNAPTITGQIQDTGGAYKGLAGLAHPDLHITTNADEVAIAIANVTAAMGNIPRSKAIRIAADIDPMIVRKSPAPIEQVMMAIERFEARDHVFKLGTTGNLDGLASYAGATDPLSYLAPSMRDMPAWAGYTQSLGDGLRLLGDQTPAIQDLGDGLTLLGDQWARQASGMNDLAPKLPQLADGFAAVGASVTRATDDILAHASYGKTSGGPFGYLNDGIQSVGEMTRTTAGVISDVAPHWGESWTSMGDATVAALNRADQFAFGASKNILGYVDHAIQRIDDLIAEIGKIPGIHVNTAAATPFSTGALTHRALGGPVSAGQAYIVGENRPELFVPQTSGYILPNVPAVGGQASGVSLSIGDIHIHPQPGDDAHAIADQIFPAILDKWDQEMRMRGLR